jgi:DNA invertase Pin-like site-specific DNA recombinase
MTRTANRASEAYCKRAGIDLIAAFYDAAVKGSDPVETRPGFAAMLEAIEGDETRTIIVETANRFARDLMTQEVGSPCCKSVVLT